MKRVFALFCLFLLGIALPAQQPGVPRDIVANQITLPLSSPPQMVSSGSAHVVGNPGNGIYYYWVVANFPVGNSSPAGPFVAINAPAVLSASDAIQVSWSPVPGATSYDVLRTSTPQAPAGSCNCAIVIAEMAAGAIDQGAALQAYTVQSFDPAGANVTLSNEAESAALSRLTLKFGGIEKWSIDSDGTESVATLNAKVSQGTVNAAQYCFIPGILDQSCINNAGNAAAAGGHAVFIPAGVYLISGQVVFKSGVSYIGAGKGVTILKEANGANVVDPFTTDPMASGTVLKDFTIDGNAANNPGAVSPTYLLNMDAVDHTIIDDMDIGDWYGYNDASGSAPCVGFSGANSDNLIVNSYIHDCGSPGHIADGIYIGGTRNRVENNVIRNAYDTGIVGEASVDLAVTGNVLVNVAQAISEDGLIANSSAVGACICGNIIDGGSATNGSAIYIINAAGSTTSTTAVNANVIYNTSNGNGIYIGLSSGIQVSSDILSNISPAANPYKHALIVDNSDNVDINGLQVSGASGSGIVVNGSTNVILSSNQVTGNGLVNGSGMYVEDGAQYTLSSLTHSSGVCTATTATNTTLAVGDEVTIAGGTGDVACNGQYLIASKPAENQFTYNSAGSGTPTGAITVTRNSYNVTVANNQSSGKYQSYGLVITGGSNVIDVTGNTLINNANNPGVLNSATGSVWFSGNHTDSSSAYPIETYTGGVHFTNGPVVLDNNQSIQAETSSGVSVNLLKLTNDANNITRFFPGVDSGGFQWTNQAASVSWMSLTSAGLNLTTGVFEQNGVPLVYTSQTFSNGNAQSAFPSSVTANQLSLYAMEIPTPLQASKMSYWVDAGDATTTDAYALGIYNSAGTLVAHVAPVDWQYSGTARTDALVEGTVTLPAGMYFVGVTGDAATATLYSVCGAQKNFVDFASSSYAATTSGALPASITAPTLAPAQGCAPYIFLSK